MKQNNSRKVTVSVTTKNINRSNFLGKDKDPQTESDTIPDSNLMRFLETP